MGASRTTEFLIAFDHDARKQLSLEEYRDTAQALRAYGERCSYVCQAAIWSRCRR